MASCIKILFTIAQSPIRWGSECHYSPNGPNPEYRNMSIYCYAVVIVWQKHWAEPKTCSSQHRHNAGESVLMECNWLAVKHHLPKANAQKHSQDRQHQDVTSQVWSHCKPLISSSHIRSRYSKIESSLTKWQIANMKTQVEPFREQGLLPHLTYLAVMAHYALKAY